MAWSRTFFASSVRFIACNKSALVLRFSNRSSFWIDKSAHLSLSSRLVLWVRQKLAASFNVSHEYWARPRIWFRIDDMTVSLRLTETRNGTATFSHFDGVRLHVDPQRVFTLVVGVTSPRHRHFGKDDGPGVGVRNHVQAVSTSRKRFAFD